MTAHAPWTELSDEMARWRAAGRSPRFWLRDDDAIQPTEALDRLLDVTRRTNVPLALASIPQGARKALADRLAGERHVRVLVHGWAHANHAPEGQKKQELGLHRPIDIVLGELAEGRERIAGLFAEAAAPVLVPPWNRIDKALVPHLPGLGFSGLSVFGRPFAAPLAVVNSTVDIMDWHGTRGCRNHAAILGEVVAALRRAFADAGEPPVGLLIHHLVHDDAAWAFLDRLFGATNGKSGGIWLAIDDVLELAGAARR